MNPPNVSEIFYNVGFKIFLFIAQNRVCAKNSF